MLEGGCRCGAIRYEAEVDRPLHHALCHCADCRHSSGAPAMAWLAVKEEAFRIVAGEARCWRGTGGALRHFCAECGTGLYYINPEVLPGLVDIQSATLDDPARYAPDAQIQCAERLEWMARLGELPEFERFPQG